MEYSIAIDDKDIFAKRDILFSTIRTNHLKSFLYYWKTTTEVNNWFDPNSSSWKWPKYDIPSFINKEGLEVSMDISRRKWFEQLLQTSKNNLIDEDESASVIQAAIKGYIARQNNYNENNV